MKLIVTFNSFDGAHLYHRLKKVEYESVNHFLCDFIDDVVSFEKYENEVHRLRDRMQSTRKDDDIQKYLKFEREQSPTPRTFPEFMQYCEYEISDNGKFNIIEMPTVQDLDTWFNDPTN